MFEEFFLGKKKETSNFSIFIRTFTETILQVSLKSILPFPYSSEKCIALHQKIDSFKVSKT